MAYSLSVNTVDSLIPLGREVPVACNPD